MELTAADFREPSAARAGGNVLAVASVLVATGLLFHSVPAVEDSTSIAARDVVR